MYSAAAAENSLDVSGAVIDSQCLSVCVCVCQGQRKRNKNTRIQTRQCTRPHVALKPAAAGMLNTPSAAYECECQRPVALCPERVINTTSDTGGKKPASERERKREEEKSDRGGRQSGSQLAASPRRCKPR